MDVIYRVADVINWVMPLIIILYIITPKLFGERPRIISHVFFELRPLYIPAHIIVAIHHLTHNPTGNDWFDLTVGFALAWMMWRYKDDDDRWKRRRRKLAEKVEAVGGKLTVVPVGSPA